MSITTVTFDLITSAALVQDLDTYWRGRIAGQSGTIAVAALSTDTSLQVAFIDPRVIVGTCLTLDNEPMTVTAITPAGTNPYAQITVSRGTSQTTPQGSVSFPLAVPAAHAINTAVNFLTYSTPWTMIAAEALLPWTQKAIYSLGLSSAMFQSSMTGTVSLGS